ncbi:MAG: hypothetical protein K2K81_07320 [Muribaculaceae bacterium]|nr:hypothetical protein [Muribaculaceae bacterium]
MNETEIKKLIGKYANELHKQIGATIDAFMIENNLPEDAVMLNIVFNALANNIQAIVENNKDIPAESAELMIQRLAVRLRKAYQQRCN